MEKIVKYYFDKENIDPWTCTKETFYCKGFYTERGVKQHIRKIHKAYGEREKVNNDRI